MTTVLYDRVNEGSEINKGLRKGHIHHRANGKLLPGEAARFKSVQAFEGMLLNMNHVVAE
jgi:hypothetical protein